VTPALSVVIPVYNEEAVLPSLFERLYPVLDALRQPYEVVFVDDGSLDRSVALLRRQYDARPDVTRVIVLNGNFGQHMAILAAFQHTKGQCVVTLDADLQNPPEEIPKLLDAMREGADYVGTIRKDRQDAAWRRWASKGLNALRERTTGIHIGDQGCMLRAYDRSIIDLINRCPESNTFVPALAYSFARSPREIEVAHAERAAGISKYSLYRLIRLNFDLMTGFSVVPLQVFSMVGLAITGLSFVLVLVLALRRLIVGPEVEGVFTLFGIVFFLVGICLFGIGLLGEYVVRIYQEVRQRPRYVIRTILGPEEPRP
jgi:undecaprenyl-phosphate 4-deoxy-4-formamido-L-arabinose transferase